MSTGDWSESEEPEIGARGLTLCRRVEFDASHPDAPYTLRGILSVFHVRGRLPGVWREPVWLYVEFFGEPGDREVWFDLVRLVYDEGGQLVDEIEETSYGPYALSLLPGLFVQGRSYFLPRVPFTEAGIHEFRLHVAGVSDVLVSQRFLVEV